jgi:hypothetical protein
MPLNLFQLKEHKNIILFLNHLKNIKKNFVFFKVFQINTLTEKYNF